MEMFMTIEKSLVQVSSPQSFYLYAFVTHMTLAVRVIIFLGVIAVFSYFLHHTL